ncbi:MAG: hypothetical protein ABW006_05965 [Hyphomicrobium sp.]
MKSSFSNATAALRGLAGWFSVRTDEALSDNDHIPFVVSACGYPGHEDESTGGSRALLDRWSPGLNVDNFS